MSCIISLSMLRIRFGVCSSNIIELILICVERDYDRVWKSLEECSSSQNALGNFWPTPSSFDYGMEFSKGLPVKRVYLEASGFRDCEVILKVLSLSSKQGRQDFPWVKRLEMLALYYRKGCSMVI